MSRFKSMRSDALPRILLAVMVVFLISIPAYSEDMMSGMKGMTSEGMKKAEDTAGQMDMKSMDMKGMDMYKGMSGMDMTMSKEMIEDLKKAIPAMRSKTDEEIKLGMAMMPKNYEWYISDKDLKGKIGVLLVAHGGGKVWDEVLKKSIEHIATTFPTAIGFGMSMMMSSHIQSAVDDLVSAGAENIVVIPTALTGYNSLKRQWDYIFGKSDKAAYLAVPQIKTTANIIMADVMNANPLVAEIMLDHAKEISSDPAKEIVIILGHGPEDMDDNNKVLAVMDVIAKGVKKFSSFSEVFAMNLQDDAEKPIRAGNVVELRKIVENATKEGKTALVVGLLMSTRGIQHKIKDDLKGLEYKFNTKGMAEHPNFSQWIEGDLMDEIEKL